MKNRILSLQSQIKLIRENLNVLELRQAKYGLDIPISLLNEIRDLRAELGSKEKELQQLLKLKPDLEKMYGELSVALDNGHFEQAIKLCDKITELSPGYRDVLDKRVLAQSRVNEKIQQQQTQKKLVSAIKKIKDLIENESFFQARTEIISVMKRNPHNKTLAAIGRQVDAKLLTQKQFVSRGNLLNRMKDVMPSCLKGQGAVRLVTGEPGAGKTYLVREFIRQIQTQYSNVIATFGTCSPYGDTSEAYEPFQEALGFLVGTTRLTWDENYLSSIENYKRVFCQSSNVRDTIVESGPALTNTLISAHDLGQDPRPDQSGVSQTGLFHQFATVIELISKNSPLIFVLEDFQWANRSSIDLFSYLARNTKLLPIVLIVTYRSTDLAIVESDREHPFLHILSELKRRYGDIEISISSSDTSADKFVQEYLDVVYSPHKFHPQFRHVIAKRTGDNALFLSELLQYLNDIGSIHQDVKGNWVCPKLLDIESLPVKIEAVIEERINQLEDRFRDILISASVEGEEFTAQVLSSIQKIEERRLLKYLTQSLIRQYRLIEEQGSRVLGKQRLYFFRFRHILFQQYIYNSLTDIEKELLHQDVGLCLEELCSSNLEEVSHLLVRHFREAHMWRRVIEYSMMAAERVSNAFAYHEAISFYDQAIEAIAKFRTSSSFENDSIDLVEAKAEVLQGRGDILLQLEYLNQAIDDYHAALDLHILDEVELKKRLGRAKEFMGFWEEAFGYYQVCLKEYRSSKNQVGIIEITIRLGAISKQMGDWDKALGFLFQALEQSKSMGSKYWEARTDCNIGMVYFRKQDLKTSLQYHKKDLEISRDLNDLVGIERSLANTGEVYLAMGKTCQALESLLEAVDFFSKLGGEPHPVTYRNIGIAYKRLGDFSQANEYFQISLEEARKQNRLQEVSWTLCEIGKMELQNGNLSEAEANLKESIEYAQKICDRWRLSHSLYSLGQVLREKDKLHKAKNTLEEARGLAQEVGDNVLLDQISTVLDNL